MPLPESGPISAADINTELGNDAGTTVDIDDVSTNDFGLDRPHGFDEFYGLSLNNFASFISLTPTSITNASAQGQTTTITYNSDGGFKINDDNISWASVAIGSGSEGTGNTFDIVIEPQLLNAQARSGNITLESPSLTNITFSISQVNNDATLSISRQTGIMSYGYNGGTGEYYKIETSPESQVTWIASIGNTTYFSHRIYNSGNSFTTSNLSGTGDEFIEVKAETNDTTSTQTGTITVDPQNIDDPTVTDSVSLSKQPTFSLSPATSINNVDWFSTSNFSYNVYGSSNKVRFTVTSNYDINTITDNSSDWTSTKYSSTQFDVYPNSLNSSSSTRTVTVSINMNSNPTTTYTVQVSQGGAPNASITPTGTSDWSYNEYGSGQYKTISVTISNYPATNPSLTLSMFGNGKFVFRTDLTSGVTYTNDIQGDATIAQKSNPGNGTFYFYVYPKDANNTTSDVDVDISVSVGGASGTISLTQLAQPDFTYSDAFVQGFAVAYDGGVTPPYAVNGTITTLNYDPDYSSGTYPIVYIPTNRYVDVTVEVPSGWPNTGGSVSGREYATQDVPPRLIEISAYNGTSTSITGDTTSFPFTINDVYYSNTSWTLTHQSSGTSALQNVTIATSTGNGDSSPNTVFFDQNTSGNTRSSVFRVTAGNYYDEITITQTSYTPNAASTLSITSGDTSFDYDETTSQDYKALTITVDSGTISTATISMSSDYFKFVDYGTGDGGMSVTNPYGPIWQASSSTNSTSYKVYIIPKQQNTSGADYSVSVSAQVVGSNGTAVTSTNSPLTITQAYYVEPLAWSRTPSSLLWFYNSTVYDSFTVSFTGISSTVTWRVLSNNYDFSVSTDASTWVNSLSGLTNSSSNTSTTIYVKPDATNTSTTTSKTGTLTLNITDNGSHSNTPTNLSVSLTQQAAPDTSCLLVGTKILLADGNFKRVQRLEVGDILKSVDIIGMSDGELESLNFQSNELNYSESTTVVKSITKETVKSIYCFYNEQQRVLQSSNDHQHFIKRGDTYQFKKSMDVIEGDYLVNKNGELIEIESIVIVMAENTFDVYKVDVEDLDLFIANDMITHNAKGKGEL